MDANQIFGTGIDIYNSLPQSTQEAMLNPAAKTLGEALDGAATIICSPLLVLGPVSKALLHKFSNEIVQKINGIPQENRDTSKLGLVIKTMEEARYQLNENDIRKMYVNLISSTVDNRKNDVVSPRLATVVAQFGFNEADFLKILYRQNGRQLPYGQLRLTLDNVYGYTFPAKVAIADSSNIINGFNSSLDILTSLGVANDKQGNRLAQRDDRYAQIESILRTIIHKPKGHENSTYSLVASYIDLTNFGRDLCECIFE